MKLNHILPFSYDIRVQITEANPTPNPSQIEIESPIISFEDFEGKSLLNTWFEGVTLVRSIWKGVELITLGYFSNQINCCLRDLVKWEKWEKQVLEGWVRKAG